MNKKIAYVGAVPTALSSTSGFTISKTDIDKSSYIKGPVLNRAYFPKWLNALRLTNLFYLRYMFLIEASLPPPSRIKKISPMKKNSGTIIY